MKRPTFPPDQVRGPLQEAAIDDDDVKTDLYKSLTHYIHNPHCPVVRYGMRPIDRNALGLERVNVT